MKKIVILLFVVMAALSVKAQVYVGGTLSLWHDDNADATTFILRPEAGYNLNEKWAVGAELLLQTGKQDEFKYTTFALAPYARYTFFENKLIRLFADGGIGFSTYKPKEGDSTTGFELGVRPGIAIKLTDHLCLLSKVGFIGYRDDYMGANSGAGFSLSSQDLSFGFHYTF